jgi:formamidopyrimidine-DNA glycosylase
MTGQLLYNPKDNNIKDHIRAIIKFTDNSELHFKDTRKFGRIYHIDHIDDILYKIGIDAVDPLLDEKLFKSLLKKSRVNIKSFLLAQDKISGVGNIYADESLFRAGIHPTSQSNKIPNIKIKSLHTHLLDILNTAIENMGSTISDYRDSYGNTGNNQKFFRVYQRKGEPCVNCLTPISKSKIAGRGTHFCIKCQKIYN